MSWKSSWFWLWKTNKGVDTVKYRMGGYKISLEMRKSQWRNPATRKTSRIKLADKVLSGAHKRCLLKAYKLSIAPGSCGKNNRIFGCKRVGFSWISTWSRAQLRWTQQEFPTRKKWTQSLHLWYRLLYFFFSYYVVYLYMIIYILPC